MTIGIIGSGAIGTAFARTLARSGIEAVISNSRGPDSLKQLVRELAPSIFQIHLTRPGKSAHHCELGLFAHSR